MERRLKIREMKINSNKTEVMMVIRETEKIEIRIDGVNFKLVKDLKYLRVIVNEKRLMGKRNYKENRKLHQRFKINVPTTKVKTHSTKS